MREWRRKIREERGKLAEERKGEMDQPHGEGFWQDPIPWEITGPRREGLDPEHLRGDLLHLLPKTSGLEIKESVMSHRVCLLLKHQCPRPKKEMETSKGRWGGEPDTNLQVVLSRNEKADSLGDHQIIGKAISLIERS